MRRDYTRWHLHGEGNSDEDEDNSSDDEQNIDDIHNMIRDAYPHMRDVEETSGSELQDPNEEAKEFYRLVKEADQPLYLGCKNYSNLSFIVKLMHIKCKISRSNSSFTILLELLKDAFQCAKNCPYPTMGQRRL